MPDFVIKHKKKRDYEQFTCRIESDLLETIKRTVLDYNLPSINEFINDCLRFSIENLKIMEDVDEEWIQHRWFRYYQPAMDDLEIQLNQIPSNIKKKRSSL